MIASLRPPVHDWFQGLTVPGSPGTMCCTIADCRIVESRWNEQTQHYEAKMILEAFNKGLGQAVFRWSVFNREANGVCCFVPFIAAFNERSVRITMFV